MKKSRAVREYESTVPLEPLLRKEQTLARRQAVHYGLFRAIPSGTVLVPSYSY